MIFQPILPAAPATAVLLERDVLRRVPDPASRNTCRITRGFAKGDKVGWFSHGSLDESLLPLLASWAVRRPTTSA